MQEKHEDIKRLEKFIVTEEIRRQANEAERIAKDERREKTYGTDSTYITLRDPTGVLRKIGVDASGCITIDSVSDWGNIPEATQQNHGLMAALDKIKLDSLPEGIISENWLDTNLR